MKARIIVPAVAGLVVAGIHAGTLEARPERIAFLGGAETTIHVPARVDALRGGDANDASHGNPTALDRYRPAPRLVGEKEPRLLC